MFKNNNQITKNQYMFIVQNSMIGVGILSLASGVCKDAQQSGWISVLIGGIYPLYLTIAASIIYKNLYFNEFLEINRRIYGKFLSYIFVIFFLVNFILFETFVLSGFANVLVFSTVKFLSPLTVIILTIVLSYFTVNQGLTTVGRLAELMFYLTIFILIIPLYFINKGDTTNILPLFSSFNSILKAVPSTFFSYSGVEICFLVIPFVTDTKKVLSSGIIGSIFTIALYTITVLFTINYCGWRLTSKLHYPLLYLVSGAELSVLSNFEPLFLFLWGNKIFQTLAVGNFGMSYTMSQITKIPLQRCSLYLSLLVIFISTMLVPEYNRSNIIDKAMPVLVVIILIWTTITLFLSFFKRGAKVEKN
ncbi:Spore germination protein YndE [Caloramator mitchellensis]|uniref:Spore germination protein YndE n=1 Tax=Caloramator mitchellensis TaxID=908809 RepID=A0A0R3JWI6_CALMK|nr:GerAB/ArcD/ProY family transporter [Caloramator mitchellensis]KRQ87911.1 Spore germination protein YndE [Caloramator mitchellensis]